MTPYETAFAGLFGAGYQAFSFWKARVALYAIIKAPDLKQDAEVILPGYTCVVVPNATRFAGARPVYADIASGQYNLSAGTAERLIRPQTQAVVVQHTYGIPAGLDALGSLADAHRMALIEDCAHVLPGSRYQGKLLGSFGTAAFFSFQWSKPYTTGLGGMVVTRDANLARKLKDIQASFREPPVGKTTQLQIQYRLYHYLFKPSLYWCARAALKASAQFGLFVGSSNATELTGQEPFDLRWRMSPFQQRLGLTQLKRIGNGAHHQQGLVKYYTDSLRQHGWPLERGIDSTTRLLRFPIRVANKVKLLEESRRANIELGSWFETPLHPLLLSQHSLVDYRLGSCPVAEFTAATAINLPLHNRVSQADAEKIVEFIVARAKPVATRASKRKVKSTRAPALS